MAKKSKTARAPTRPGATKPRGWGKTLNYFFLGGLFIDLALYFAFNWYTIPLVLLGFFLVNDSVPRKLGIWKTTGASLFFATITTVMVFAIKIWNPELLKTWEEIDTPLKWILP